MAKHRHTQAVFKFSTSIPQLILDVKGLKQTITTSPANTYVSIPPATITQLENHLTVLEDKEVKVGKADGATAARDEAEAAVIRDVRELLALVQIAANRAEDELEAVTIIETCGMKVRKKKINVKAEIAVTKDKKLAGVLRLTSKAAKRGLRASYEWQMSLNGINFTTIKTSTGSRTTYTTTAEPGTKLYFRRRIILSESNGGTMGWSQTIYIIIT